MTASTTPRGSTNDAAIERLHALLEAERTEHQALMTHVRMLAATHTAPEVRAYVASMERIAAELEAETAASPQLSDGSARRVPNVHACLREARSKLQLIIELEQRSQAGQEGLGSTDFSTPMRQRIEADVAQLQAALDEARRQLDAQKMSAKISLDEAVAAARAAEANARMLHDENVSLEQRPRSAAGNAASAEVLELGAQLEAEQAEREVLSKLLADIASAATADDVRVCASALRQALTQVAAPLAMTPSRFGQSTAGAGAGVRAPQLVADLEACEHLLALKADAPQPKFAQSALRAPAAAGSDADMQAINAQLHAEKEAEVKAVREESLRLLQATAIARDSLVARARLGGDASGRCGSVA